MIRPAIATLLLTTTSVLAQISLDAESLRLPIGSTFTMESVSFQGTIESTGIVVGPPGANESFDLTGPIQGQSSLLRGSVISLQEAPDRDDLPTADYAARYDIDTPDGASVVMFVYFQRREQGDLILGIEGPEGTSTPIPTVDSTVPLPLKFGARWENIESSSESEVGPGVQVRNTVTQSGEVDGWGTVTVPAGSFPCLRVSTTASGVSTYHGNPDLEALGELDTTSRGLSWSTYHLGTVAAVSQTVVSARNGSVPTVTMTQIIRITEVSGLPSVVAAVGWAHLKTMQFTNAPARP